jgi:hypothetical protein
MTAKFNEPGDVRAGWRKVNGKWEPIPDSETPRAKTKVNVDGLDGSLEASHGRMTRTLAIESARLETLATQTSLSVLDIEVLGRLSNTWRTLAQNEPTKDLSHLSPEEIEAKLAELKRR